VDLRAGANKELTTDIDPRLLASFDPARHGWVIAEGNYKIILATDANTPVATATIHLTNQQW
jgi:beta-glucosidase